MRHVVVGGSGFTGAHLCSVLAARGDTPVVFDLVPPADALAGRVSYIRGDITDPSDILNLALGPDDVVHNLAARQFHGRVPRREREAWFDAVNVKGLATLLAVMARGGASRLVFFSTDMTYGIPERTPVPSDHPQRPIGPYGRSKLAAERLLINARARDGIRATIFRPRLIAGAGRLGILAKLFRLIRLGAPVPMIGSGGNRYQMVAVEDCVSAALAAIDAGCPMGPFNLGSENPPQVRALLQTTIARAGSRSVLVPTPARMVQAVLGGLDRVGLPLLYPEQFAIAAMDYVLDCSASQAALGWRPTRRDEDILWEAYCAFRKS